MPDARQSPPSLRPSHPGASCGPRGWRARAGSPASAPLTSLCSVPSSSRPLDTAATPRLCSIAHLLRENSDDIGRAPAGCPAVTISQSLITRSPEQAQRKVWPPLLCVGRKGSGSQAAWPRAGRTTAGLNTLEVRSSLSSAWDRDLGCGRLLPHPWLSA